MALNNQFAKVPFSLIYWQRMALVELINSLIDDIGSGLSEAKIRSRLLSLREQAEAFEARLQQVEADFKRLEANTEQQNLTQKEGRLDEISEKLLRFLSGPQRPSLEQAAKALGIAQIVAQHHANILVEKGMIDLGSAGQGQGRYSFSRTVCTLTPKGTAYVVENKPA